MGFTGKCGIAVTMAMGVSREGPDQGNREKETEHSSRMSQDREWRTEPTLFVLLTNRRKLTFGRLCEGVIVKKSAQHESPTLSLRISFFIRPFTSMFVSDGLSPVFKLAASMLGLNH